MIKLRWGWGAGRLCLLAMLAALAGCGGRAGGDVPDPPRVTWGLSVSVTGPGAVADNGGTIQCGTACSTQVPTNTSVTLTATPAAGSRLSAWGGACSGQAATCTVLMDAAKSVTAAFEAVGGSTFALTVAVTGQGTVTSAPAGIQCGTTCQASFAANAVVTLTAAPGQGQVLSTWGGACSGQAATCTVTMGAARSVTATFSAAPPPARAWQTAELLENNNDFNVAGTNTFADARLLTAIDAAGNALAVWEQSDGTPDGNTLKVYSRRYVAGQGWAPAVAISGLSGTSSMVSGRLLMDAAGNAVWVRQNFEARRYTASGGWSAPVSPTGSFVGSLADAQITAAGQLNVLRSGDGNVWHATLPAGTGAWSAWAEVAGPAATANVTGGVRLALSANGTAVAVWRERNQGDPNDSVWANRRTATGWLAKARIEEVLTDAQETPGLGMDANGNAIVAWHQGDSLYVNRFDAATSSWGQATEFDAGQASSTSQAKVDLVMAADGRAVVGWNSGLFPMKAMVYVPGSGFSTPVTVAPYTTDRAMGMDAQGRVVIVYRSPSQWPNPTEPMLNVYSRSLAPGGTWSDAALLETGAGDTKGGVVLAMNGAGQAVCLWAQNDLASSSVRNSLWAALLR